MRFLWYEFASLKRLQNVIFIILVEAYVLSQSCIGPDRGYTGHVSSKERVFIKIITIIIIIIIIIMLVIIVIIIS